MMFPETNTGTVRAALYYRVSTPGQVEAFGFEAQKTILREHTRRMGWEIVGEYEDPGISGDSLLYRPGMQKLLRDAETGAFDVAVAVEAKRFSRGDMMDWGLIAQVCDRNRVRLATPEGFVYEPGNKSSRLMLWVNGGMSEMEKQEIRERFERGKNQAIAEGKLPHGTAPFGFRFERYGEKRSQKRLVIVPEEAATIRYIFECMADGINGRRVGSQLLADHLNLLGYATPPQYRKTGEPIRAPQWTGPAVARIVRNPVYRGEWAFHKTRPVVPEKRRTAHRKCNRDRDPSEWEINNRKSVRFKDRSEWTPISDPKIIPPIVDPDLWERANRMMQIRAEHFCGKAGSRRKNGEPAGLLSGYVRCPLCKSNYRHMANARGEQVWRYYVCCGRSQAKQRGCEPCPNRRWRAEELEKAVWERLVSIIRSPDLLQQIIDASAPPEEEDARAGRELARTQKDLENLIAAEQHVKTAHRAGAYVTPEEFKAELEIIRQERAELLKQIERLGAAVQAREEWEAAVSFAANRCAAYRVAAEDPSPQVRRGIIEDLVSEIIAHRDRPLELFLLFDTAKPAGEVGIQPTACRNSLVDTHWRVSIPI